MLSAWRMFRNKTECVSATSPITQRATTAYALGATLARKFMDTWRLISMGLGPQRTGSWSVLLSFAKIPSVDTYLALR